MLDRYFGPPQEFTDDFGDYRSPLTFYDGRAVTSADEWQARREEILSRWHGMMGPWPELIENPRTGAYKRMVGKGYDLHELHALMAPRPFLVSGGSEDKAERWRALNHAVAVNAFLGYTDRVAMTNREGHSPTAESNDQVYQFFERFLK